MRVCSPALASTSASAPTATIRHPDRHRLGAGLVIIHGKDDAVAIDEFRG